MGTARSSNIFQSTSNYLTVSFDVGSVRHFHRTTSFLLEHAMKNCKKKGNNNSKTVKINGIGIFVGFEKLEKKIEQQFC